MPTTSAIVYSDPSKIDGSPIVVIVTGMGKKSANIKTGKMVQTYILRSDVHPNTAIHDGRDYAICGSCVHRGVNGKGRTCYVRMDAPSSVYRAFQRGSYPTVSPSDLAPLVAGRALRIGTYGDPSAVPEGIFAPLVAVAGKVTGYTHRSTVTKVGCYPYLMASVDNVPQLTLAHLRGLRTFRVIGDARDRIKGEILCPASEEMGRKTTCEKCALCDARRKGPHVAIVVHGVGKTHWL